MLRFVETTLVTVAGGGRTVRHCEDCVAPLDGQRYWAWADDQSSPCPCCGGMRVGDPLPCHHVSFYCDRRQQR